MSINILAKNISVKIDTINNTKFLCLTDFTINSNENKTIRNVVNGTILEMLAYRDLKDALLKSLENIPATILSKR